MKLFAALAEARTSVDMNIAFGEAADRVRKIKPLLTWTLGIAVVVLGLAYANLHMEVHNLQSSYDKRHHHAQQWRAEILANQRKLLLHFGVKPVASTQTTD